jgi:Fe-S cluster assembly protein SufD
VTEPLVAIESARPPGVAPSGLLASTRSALGSRPRGGARVDALRAEGAAWFEGHGFPTPRDEAWRFTPLSPVLRVPYTLATAARVSTPDPFPGLEGSRIVVENGRVTTVTAPDGVDVGTRSAPFADYDAIVSAHLGRVAALEDGFDAQNAALFDDALVVRVKKGVRAEAPIVVVHVIGGAASPLLSLPRVLVVAEDGSEACFVQAHVAAEGASVLESSVTEIVLGAGARLEHVRQFEGAPHAAAVARVSVRQGADSTYASRVFTFGGALSRLTLDVTLAGKGATASLDGLYLAQSGDLLDHHTTIDHQVPHCTSRERYKGTLDGSGVAVFDGTVVVRHGASGTEAHQENRNLLLADDAIVHTKPHLRIDTDDVKCSHGATVGRLDPNHLFYLRSRGIDAEVARSVLTYAFAREMTEGVSVPALRSALDARIAARLPGGAFARELA